MTLSDEAITPNSEEISPMQEGELAPFTLLLPIQLQENFYSPHNKAASAFKSYIRVLTDGILPKNSNGQLAAGLAAGHIDQVKPKRTGLYSIEGDGRGITFHDPAKLFNNWKDLENKVGEKKQAAMRNLILNRGNPERHFKLLKKYVAYKGSDAFGKDTTS